MSELTYNAVGTVCDFYVYIHNQGLISNKKKS